MAVDPEGKIWITHFEASDSIQYRPGRFGLIRQIHCFRPDGTPAPFSPIKFLTIDGMVDTVGGQTLPNGNWDVNTNRGLKVDHDGNILASSFGRIYRINYRTGQGMKKVVVDAANSITAAAADGNGNVYVHRVVAGNQPLKIFKPDLSLPPLGNVVDTLRGFSRTVAVSKNGLQVFFMGYTNHAIYRYSRPDDFSPFGRRPDTLLKGMDIESTTWHPKTGHLWVSAGSGNDLPNRFPGARTSWSPHTWYAYNTQTNQVLDSLKWFNVDDLAFRRPRSIAFSPGGDTAYVGSFGGSPVRNKPWPTVQMFVRQRTKVEESKPITVIDGYSLSQNYPNPFNPTTEIVFSLGRAGLTTVKVYNVLGREVATLINSNLPAGEHKVKFDAAALPSGTYIYELKSNSVRLTKKMMFVR